MSLSKVMSSIKDFNKRKIDTKFIEEIYRSIDRIYFNGEIQDKLKDTNSTLKFDLSRSGKVAGKCKKDSCQYTIYLSKPLFEGLFQKGETSLKSSGLTCSSRNECLLVTLCHELVHLIIYLFVDEQVPPHGELFKCLAYEFFGQTDFRHQLNLGEASEIASKDDFAVGDTVAIKDKIGVIQKLNPKRAKVLIDGRMWTASYPLMKKVKDAQKITITTSKAVPFTTSEEYIADAREDGAVKVLGRFKTIVDAKTAIVEDMWRYARDNKIEPNPIDDVRQYENINRKLTTDQVFKIGNKVWTIQEGPKRPLTSIQPSSKYSKESFRVGDRVMVKDKVGNIVKLNPKRAVINIDGKEWTAHYELIKPVS